MIYDSELIINSDGSCFHLHLKPDDLADKIVMCGDPERVDLIASFFDTVDVNVTSREYHTITGSYNGKRISALSHGIGANNMDIVFNELDALKNIDFETRKPKEQHHTLEIVRIGTCGGLQSYVPVGTCIIGKMSIGFDGVINWYDGRDCICNLDIESELVKKINYPSKAARPYVVEADDDMFLRIKDNSMVEGIMISAAGFYGPQGRILRLSIKTPDINERITAFEHNGEHITNYEMESASLAGFAKLLGHKAVSVCLVVANRLTGESNPDYKHVMPQLIKRILDRI